MDMDVVLVEPARIDAQRAGLGLHQAQCGLGAFLHHLAQLAGQDQPPFARRLGRLDEQDVSTHGGPRQARGDARHAGAHGHLVLEAGLSEALGEIACADADGLGGAVCDADCGVAQGATDLALQAPHTGFARVGLDDGAQRRHVDLDLRRLQAIGGELAAHQVALGDLQLLAGRVAGKRYDLHPVA